MIDYAASPRLPPATPYYFLHATTAITIIFATLIFLMMLMPARCEALLRFRRRHDACCLLPLPRRCCLRHGCYVLPLRALFSMPRYAYADDAADADYATRRR